jgi:hypothetical protein
MAKERINHNQLKAVLKARVQGPSFQTIANVFKMFLHCDYNVLKAFKAFKAHQHGESSSGHTTLNRVPDHVAK